MKKSRKDDLPLFNLTSTIRKFYSRQETIESIPTFKFESNSFEQSDSDFLREYSCYKRLSRLTALLMLIFTTGLVITFGGWLFWFVERGTVILNCKDRVQSKYRYNNIRAVNSINLHVSIIEDYEKCAVEFQDTTKIEDVLQGVIFTFSIVTTIGYGHHYPHTNLGKLLTICYAILSIPLYVAVKAELGNYISLLIWKITMCLHRCVQKMCKIVTAFEAPDWEIMMVGTVFAVLFSAIFSALMTLTEPWSYTHALWFTVQTILLIGVGDLEPNNQARSKFLMFYLYFGVPMTVLGDIISSHIVYYLHGRYRIGSHLLSLYLCCCMEPKSWKSERSKEALVDRVELTHNFPTITTTALPMNVPMNEESERQQDEALLRHKQSSYGVEQIKREAAGRRALDPGGDILTITQDNEVSHRYHRRRDPHLRTPFKRKRAIICNTPAPLLDEVLLQLPET